MTLTFTSNRSSFGSPTAVESHALFTELLTPVQKHLYNFINKTMNFSHDADDIYQDAVIKAFKYFHSYDRGKNFKTWIFTIAHNLVKDYFSSHKLQLLEEMDTVAHESPNVLRDDVREIYAVAATLKPKHREVFFLHYYNECSVPEITQITGMTTVNVKFILHQARNTIKKALEV